MSTLFTIAICIIACMLGVCIGYMAGKYDEYEPVDKEKNLDNVRRFK